MVAIANRISVLSTSVNVKTLASYSAAAAHTAIQAALTSADVIYVPPGSHAIGAKLTVPSSRKLIIDYGAVLTLSSAVNASMLENADTSGGNDDITIQLDGVLQGNGANQGASSTGINIDECSKVRIFGKGSIRDFRNNGIQISDCIRVELDGLTVQGRSSGITTGIGLARTQYGAIRNCISYDNTGAGAGGYGIFVYGTTNAAAASQDCVGIVVEDCVAYNNDDDNFVLFDTKHCTVRRCVFRNSVSDKGAHIQNARYAVFEDCWFVENDLAGAAVGPAGGVADSGSRFIRCHFNNNGDDGVEVNGKNQHYIDCEATENAVWGYRAYYGVPENCLWSGGVIANNASGGISFEGASGSGAKNNTVERVHFYDDQGTQNYAVSEGANVGTGNRVNSCVIGPHTTDYFNFVNGTEGTGSLANEKLS